LSRDIINLTVNKRNRDPLPLSAIRIALHCGEGEIE
jgi:hypothetical protein